MNYKIAIASSDGKVVNQHFGRAKVFYVVEVDSENRAFTYLHSIEVTPICQRQEHDEVQLKELVMQLKHCDYVLVSKIGYGARNALEKQGIEVYEIPGFIKEAIEKLLAYVEVQKLLV